MKLMLNGKEVTGMGHYVMAGDIKDATAEDSNVLSGKAYYNNNGKREGTMPNRGGMSAELSAGGSVSIPEGYHNGEGVVRAQDLASQTPGTAAAANIEAGYTAWVNGEMVEGTGKMDTFKVSKTITPASGSSSQYATIGTVSENDFLRLTVINGDIVTFPLYPLSLNKDAYSLVFVRTANSSTSSVKVNAHDLNVGSYKFTTQGAVSAAVSKIEVGTI